MPSLPAELNNLRAMSREFSIDVLNNMLEKRRTATDGKRAEARAVQEQQVKYQQKINARLELIKADGISLNN